MILPDGSKTKYSYNHLGLVEKIDDDEGRLYQAWYDKEGRLIKILKHILKEIKDFFKYAFTRVSPDKPYSSVESRSFQKSMMDFLKKTKRTTS